MLNSPSQFNTYTAKSVHLQNKVGIYVSASFLQELGLKEGQYITLTDSTHHISGTVYIDYYLNMPCFLVSPMLQGANDIFASSAWTNLHISHKEQI